MRLECSDLKGHEAKLVLWTLVCAGAVATVSAAQSSNSAGPFTAAQATAGQSAYQANCAACHLSNLAGRNDAPPLAGATFISVWGRRNVSDLVAYIRMMMPPGAPD